MARPLSCLLRFHRWEYRENPETHEHYQVCARCNAYRDRGSSPFDGSGAWGLGVDRREAPPTSLDTCVPHQFKHLSAAWKAVPS